MITSTITSKTIDVSNFERISIAEDMIDSIQFSIPSTYEGTNLSTGTVFALYVIPGGSGDMTELASSIEGDNILAVWELKDGVVSKKGMVEFQIVILVGSTILYQTKTARFFVDRKLDPSTLEFTPNILTELLASVIEQRVLAETSAEEASVSASSILEDTGFIAVSADLDLGDLSTIKVVSTDIADVSTVAEKIADVSIVANGIADIDAVEDIASNITTVAGISTDVTAVALIGDDVSAVALNETNINAVNANKTNIDKVAAIDSDVTEVATIDTEITALGARTTEIDALYAQLDAIAEKEAS